MVAALLTVAINLNPLAKFDGYYLTVALTGINNLRVRSLQFYHNLFQLRSVRERPRDRWILLAYAPLSLLYTILVFGHLLLWLLSWMFTHIPALCLTLLGLWLLYFVTPRSLLPSAFASSPMTSTPTQASNSRPNLKVVTPLPSATATLASDQAQSPAPLNTPTTASSPSHRHWITAGIVIVGLCGLGWLPIPNSVTGDASINTRPEARQVVAIPEAATVKAMYVRLNDRVQSGQVIAELSSYNLEQQLLEVERRLTEAYAERETAQQQMNLALSRQVEARIRVQSNLQKVARLQRELRQMDAANYPPQIRQLQQQQSERQREIEGWQAQLDSLNAQLARDEQLVQEGALPASRLDEPKRQQIILNSRIRATEAQIQSLDEQIAAMQKEVQEELQEQRQPEVDLALSALNSAEQEVTSALAVVKKWEQQLPLLREQQQQLLQRQAQLKLHATVAGTVITPDLDLLVNQKLEEGKELLTIADATQPTAVVELSQVDANRVRVGMPVTFRLQYADLQGYSAKVQEIPPILTTEQPQQPQQKATVKVRIVFDDANQSFSFGTKGYAHIQLGQIHLYQKIQQELLKLFPLGRFF
jgi:multidrug resistance efflux pump